MHPILDHDLISQRYFFPQRMPLDDAHLVPVSVGHLTCWRSHPPQERPVIVFFHGNGELVHHWIDVFTGPFDAMGYDVFLAEYRGYGHSSGTPRLVAMFDDLDAIADAVGVPHERIVVFGRSVGSIYAIEWAHRFKNCAGLIIESGIHDVGERIKLRVSAQELGCSHAELNSAIARYLDHAAKLKMIKSKVLIMHAEHDNLVGLEHAKLNAQTIGSSAELKIFPKGCHNTLLAANLNQYFDVIARFLNTIQGF